MQTIKFMFVAFFAMITQLLAAQNTVVSDTIKVYGECGMCKNRIEKTLKLDGITNAKWDVDTKLLVVSYDSSKISNDAIQQKIAAVGHDTEKYQADDKVYERLPGCCHYERKKAGAAKDQSDHHH
ncbi:MAG TPA: heavy-metal-associated domain-containing protein [Chitinophagaceae bacterium]|nr:heavy-metal-associated domain-containing protein [Chitinophagaceae bacterium]